MRNESQLEKEIEQAINRACAENDSDTPDFILAQFLIGCLKAWNQAAHHRDTWYGRDPRPSMDAKRPDPRKAEP